MQHLSIYVMRCLWYCITLGSKGKQRQCHTLFCGFHHQCKLSLNLASQISSLIGGDSDDATFDSDGKIIIKRIIGSDISIKSLKRKT